MPRAPQAPRTQGLWHCFSCQFLIPPIWPSCFSLHSSGQLTCIEKELNYPCIVLSHDLMASCHASASFLGSTSCKVHVCLSSLLPIPSPVTSSRTYRVKPLIHPVVTDDQVWHRRISNMASELFNRQDVGRGSGCRSQMFCSRDEYLSGVSYRGTWQLALGTLLMQDGIKPISPLRSYPGHANTRLPTLTDNLTWLIRTLGSTPLGSSPNPQALSKAPSAWATLCSTPSPIHSASVWQKTCRQGPWL